MLLWTLAGALFGSANFTGGGFGGNEELVAEITALEEGQRLVGAAREIQRHPTEVGSYDLQPALRQAGVRREEFLAWSERFGAAGHTALAELLRALATASR